MYGAKRGTHARCRWVLSSLKWKCYCRRLDALCHCPAPRSGDGNWVREWPPTSPLCVCVYVYSPLGRSLCHHIADFLTHPKVRKWLECTEIFSVFFFSKPFLSVFLSFLSVVQDFNVKSHAQREPCLSHYSVKMRLGILFLSASLVTWSPTYTHSPSTWTQTTELARDRFIQSICFGRRPCPCPRFLLRSPFSLLALCLNSLSPPSELFSRCSSCDVLQSVSRELSVYLRPTRQWSSSVQALLRLNWWNVSALMRFFGVCACVLNVLVRVCVHCIGTCFYCDSVCEHLAGRMSSYWISVDPTALVSKNICPGAFSLPGLALH